MTKKTKKIAGIITILFILFGSFSFSYAQNESREYTPLTNLPGTMNEGKGTTNFETYFSGFFKLFMGLSAAAAFVMITVGGIQYMTTDAISGKQQGKERVTNAIVGLILVICSWTIVNIINPNILKLDLTLDNLGSIGVSGTATTSTKTTINNGEYIYNGREYTYVNGYLQGYSLTSEEIATNSRMVEDLNKGSGGKIAVNSDPCKTGQTSGCTNIVGLPVNAIQSMYEIQKECNCSLVISGGTEGGHKSHGPGKSIYDIRSPGAVDTYLKKVTNGSKSMVKGVTLGKYSGNVYYEGDHWHIEIN